MTVHYHALESLSQWNKFLYVIMSDPWWASDQFDVDLNDLSNVWHFSKSHVARFCVFKATTQFQMWGTSFKSAGGHDDDPASDAHYAAIKKLDHVGLLCSDEGPSSKVQRMHCTFYCLWFFVWTSIKANLQREQQSQGCPGCMEMERAELSDLIWQEAGWDLHKLLQATTSVYPGCQHTLQAQRSFEFCKQARHFNHQRGGDK